MPAKRVMRPADGESAEPTKAGITEPPVVEPVAPEPEPVIEEEEGELVDQDLDPEAEHDPTRPNPVRLEDADPNEDLWEGGPTVAETLKFREEHGELYVTSYSADVHYMWRTLLRHEYRFILRTIEELSNSGQVSQAEVGMVQEELTCEICMLVPKLTMDELQKGPAGVPSIIAQQILEMSGFMPWDTKGL